MESQYFESSKIIPIETYDDLTYEVIKKEEDDYIDFINEFLDLIETNLDRLKELGISTNDILICELYEYNEQCAM